MNNAELLILSLYNKGLSKNTINLYIEAFMCWAAATGKPIELKRFRVVPTIPDILTHEEIAILMEACRTAKSRCIVATMLHLGLRPTECIELRIGDLRLNEDFIDIKNHGRGPMSSERSVPLTDEYVQFLNQWLEERSQLAFQYDYRPLQPDDYLFITQNNQPYTIHALNQLLRRITAKTKLSGKVHPYKLRQTHKIFKEYYS